MFASLKNKIREETGSDVVMKVNPPVFSKRGGLRGRHSRQGSTTSLNSIISAEGSCTDDQNNSSALSSRIDDEELNKIITRKEQEFERRLKDKEKEWRRQLEENNNEKIILEKQKEELESRIQELEDVVQITEDQKRKLSAYREDKEQLENLQAQEIAKVKQLLLAREKELVYKSTSLKESNDLVESLRAQISRLRHNEQELSCVQDELETLRHSSAREKATLASQLAQSEEETRHLRVRVELLERRIMPDDGEIEIPIDERIRTLTAERTFLEQRLEEAHLHLTEIKSSWSEKIAFLETQVGRLGRQAAEESSDRRRTLSERDMLTERIKQLEFEVEKNRHDLLSRDVKINRLISEIDELSTELRNVRAESDEDVMFLRKQIENSGEQLKELRERLAEAELRADNAQIECSRVTVSVEKEQHVNKALRTEIEGLKRELEAEQKRCIELCSSFDKERSEKDVTLLRNAQVSQEVEIARQKIVHQDSELNELHARLTDLEKTIILKDSQIHKSEDEVNGLKTNIGKLEEDVLERDKNIKILQHRLAIMKKTLQRELRSNDSDQSMFLGDPSNLSDGGLVNSFSSAAVLSPSSNTTKHLVGTNDGVSKFNSGTPNEEDINFKYLKHVIIKFLTSREYEAKHLTRAVATLLKFSPDEERLLHETLEWKMSWFGSRPKLGNGQLAKAIPPS